MGRRHHPPHPPAQVRVLAPLPQGRHLAAAASGDARRDRDGGVDGGVLQRPDRRDVPRAGVLAASVVRATRSRPVQRRRRPRPVRRAAPVATTIGAPRSPRCSSTSGCCSESATSTAARCCGRASCTRSRRSASSARRSPGGSSTSRPGCSAPTWPTPNRSPCPACPVASASTGAPVRAASAAPTRCAPATAARTTGSSTGARAARPASPRLRRRPPTARPTNTRGQGVPRRRPLADSRPANR